MGHNITFNTKVLREAAGGYCATVIHVPSVLKEIDWGVQLQSKCLELSNVEAPLTTCMPLMTKLTGKKIGGKVLHVETSNSILNKHVANCALK